MTAPADRSERAHRTAALCELLGSTDEARRWPEVAAAAARAREALRAGAEPAELEVCFDALDRELRRAGYANGLVHGSRGTRAPGVVAHIKAAVCPASDRCTRVERARDLWPTPLCAVHETRMHKTRLA
ncbi:hypothetical protein [Streptomyces cavernicola]|uniref:Uncharacterized protein n=1 Tax=Streptomyces cavernicola TaxID=3043613 RepID=A0ABT6SM17_9ACTN|nr:hypothetical protein [Streptomyces sp. B-S-A6]MDI3409235.1 hypothetical protein [Streptomyces sp. B-S-A6]